MSHSKLLENNKFLELYITYHLLYKDMQQYSEIVHKDPVQWQTTWY